MVFWKKKPKRQTTAKPKTNTASPKIAPKQEPKPKQKPTPPPPKPKPDIPKKSATGKKEVRLDARKEFLRVFKQLTYRHRAWDIWRDFIVMFACSLSNPLDKSHYDEREKRYLKIIKKYNKQEQNLFPELAAHTVMALEEKSGAGLSGWYFYGVKFGQ